MTISFPRLPWLIQEEILKQLRYSEAFALSFCSTNIRKRIKRLRYEVPRLEYHSDGKNITVGVNDGDFKKIFTVWKYRALWNYEQMNFGWDDGLIVSFQEPMRDSRNCQKFFDHHIISLFKFKGPKTLVLDLSSFYTKCAIENITDCIINGVEVNKDRLSHFLTDVPNIQNINIRTRLNFHLSPDSKLFRIENISIRAHRDSHFLMDFSGKNLIFSAYRCTIYALLMLIVFWQEDLTYRNLETFHMEAESTYENRIERFLEDCRPLQYLPENPEEQVKQFVYEPKIIGRSSQTLLFEPHDSMEFRRNTDGKRAFMKCTPNRFWFVVSTE